MTPFDFVNAINSSAKKDLLKEDPSIERVYNSFVINRAFSYFPDTILYANELNQYPELDIPMQNSYYLNSVRPSKRYAKWVKKQDNSDIEAVREYYGYNIEKTLQVMSVLSSEQLQIIKNKLAKGTNHEFDRKSSRGQSS